MPQRRATTVNCLMDSDDRLFTRPRAGAAIVDAAKALIRHNRTRVDKDYRPVLTEPGEIVIRGYSSPEIEARQVAAAIAELLGQGEAPGQITILYRAGAIGLNFQTALKERQIPFKVRGSGDLWRSVGARLVVGALHYLHGGATVAAMSRLDRKSTRLNSSHLVISYAVFCLKKKKKKKIAYTNKKTKKTHKTKK